MSNTDFWLTAVVGLFLLPIMAAVLFYLLEAWHQKNFGGDNDK